MTTDLLERIGDTLAWQPGDPVVDREVSVMRGNAHRRLFEVFPDHLPSCNCGDSMLSLSEAFFWRADLASGTDPCSPRIVGVPESVPTAVVVDEAPWINQDTWDACAHPSDVTVGFDGTEIVGYAVRSVPACSYMQVRITPDLSGWESAVSEAFRRMAAALADLPPVPVVFFGDLDYGGPQRLDLNDEAAGTTESSRDRALRLRRERNTGPPRPRLDGRRSR